MPTKTCSKCQKTKPTTEFYAAKSTKDKLAQQCKACAKAYCKAYESGFGNHRLALKYKRKRAADSLARANANPEKVKARSELHAAMKRGEVVKPTRCCECGKQKKLDGHHDDYTKPLEVRWFCRSCHVKYHLSKKKVAS